MYVCVFLNKSIFICLVALHSLDGDKCKNIKAANTNSKSNIRSCFYYNVREKTTEILDPMIMWVLAVLAN